MSSGLAAFCLDWRGGQRGVCMMEDALDCTLGTWTLHYTHIEVKLIFKLKRLKICKKVFQRTQGFAMKRGGQGRCRCQEPVGATAAPRTLPLGLRTQTHVPPISSPQPPSHLSRGLPACAWLPAGGRHTWALSPKAVPSSLPLLPSSSSLKPYIKPILHTPRRPCPSLPSSHLWAKPQPGPIQFCPPSPGRGQRTACSPASPRPVS